MIERLQKKCFIAATGLHLSLLVILFVGPAFLPGKKQVEVPELNFTPDDLIESMLAGGGSPQPAAARPTPPTPTPTPAPPPPPRAEPTPTPPQREERDEVVEPTTRPVQKERDPDALTTAKKKKAPNVNLQKVTRKNPTSAPKSAPKSNATADSRSEADEQRSRLAAALNNAGRSVSSGVSASTPISISDGPGGGGRSYAGYDMFVRQAYQLRYDRALADAGDISGNSGNTSVEVTITVSRDGNVVSSKITSPSANGAQNRIVQRVLDAVTFIRPFPGTSTESQRTFNLSFDLKPKKLTG